MTPDEINNLSATELRIEIAKAKGAKWYPIIGHPGEYILAYNLAGFDAVEWPDGEASFGFHGIPDWPSDIAAAMGLLDDHGTTTLQRVGPYHVAGIKLENGEWLHAIAMDGTCAKIKRCIAICRAWLAAKANS